MKIGDLVTIRDLAHRPLHVRLDVHDLRHHLGVIVATTSDEVSAALVAWTNGEERWHRRWRRTVKPYEGYAGKKHNDIK